jgi:DNA-binding transcriptional LysR family regulator
MKNLNRVHLSGLRAVEAVGRLGNLSAAAEELGVTIGAVSQQVQRTEAALDRTLFTREPKGLWPTPTGSKICARLTAGMTELSRAVAIAEDHAESVLTISVAPIFAARWLVWRLSRFREIDPDVRVRIDADASLVDPNTSDVDACIRVGPGDWPGVQAEWLLEQRIFPVCHPDWARKLKSPADLRSVPVVRESHGMFDWDAWLKPNGLEKSALGDGPVYSDGSLCLDAAIAGQGVAMVWETLASHALETGQVVAPFPDRIGTGHSYWFVTGRNTRTTKQAVRFREWLKAELSVSAGRDFSARS